MRRIIVFLLGMGFMGACPKGTAALPHITIHPQRPALLDTKTILQHDIAEHQNRQVADLFNMQPGLEVRDTGGSTNLYLRGTNSAHNLVLMHGVPLNDPSGNGAFSFQTLDPTTVEKIEIITGAKAFYEGSGALGGVVRLTPKSLLPTGSEKETESPLEARFEGGAFDTRRGSLIVGHRRQTLGLITQMGSSHSGSKKRWNPTHQTFNADGTQQDNASVMLEACPTKDYGLSLFLQGHQSKTHINGYMNALPQFTGDQARGYGQQGILSQRLATLDGRLTHTLVMGAQQLRRKHVAAVPQTYISQRQTFAYEADYEVSEKVMVNAGASYGRVSDLSHTSFQKTFDEKGIKAKVTVTPLERVTFFVSGRLDKHEKFQAYPTGQTGVTWAVAKNTTIETSTGTGFKAPEAQTFLGNTTFQQPNPQAKPEKAFLWDVSMVQNFPSLALSLKATYFLENIKDVLVWDPGRQMLVNRNERSIKGLELSARKGLGEQIQLTGSMTVIRAFDRQPAQRAFVIPPVKTTVGVLYTPTKAWIVFVDGVHKSRRLDFGNQHLSALVDVRAGARYKTAQGFEFFGRVENALNEKNEEAYGFGRRGFGVYGGMSFKG